jgi:hypothetical protein
MPRKVLAKGSQLMLLSFGTTIAQLALDIGHVVLDIDHVFPQIRTIFFQTCNVNSYIRSFFSQLCGFGA